MKKYQPSNGSEGDWFIEKYCMNCVNCDPDPSGKKQCEILLRSFCLDVNDSDYPKEWIFDKDQKPICTAHQQWDWKEKGNPDDHENENYIMPHNSNQTELFKLPQ